MLSCRNFKLFLKLGRLRMRRYHMKGDVTALEIFGILPSAYTCEAGGREVAKNVLPKQNWASNILLLD